MNEDFEDLLTLLVQEKARFVVVGAHALAVHGVPRATGDLDIWTEPDLDNADRVYRGLTRFGAPLEAQGITREDFSRKGTVYQIGLPPRRIDILTEIDGVDFESAWTTRAMSTVGSLSVPFLGRAALLQNKKATGRPKDLADVYSLEGRKE
jgi:hypothetical protein